MLNVDDVVDRYRDMILFFGFRFFLVGVAGSHPLCGLLYVSVDDVNVDLYCA